MLTSDRPNQPIPAKLRLRPAPTARPSHSSLTYHATKRIKYSHPSSRPPRPNIPSLPHDILLQIFKYLPPVPTLCTLSQVCTSWKSAALSPELWSCVVASDADTRRRNAQRLQSNYQYICYGTGAARADASPDVDDAPKKKRKRLCVTKRTKRALQGIPLAVEVITARARSKLRVLDLRNCYPTSQDYLFQMTNSELALIETRSSSSLQQLCLSPWNCVTGQAVLHLASACPRLVKLHAVSCRSMSIALLGSIVRKCPLLQDVSVSSCSAFRGYDLVEKIRPIRRTIRHLDISDTSTAGLDLRHLLCDFPALVQLIADNCEYLHLGGPPPAWMYLSTVHSNLQTLSINKICHISVGWLRVIYRMCPKLQLLAVNQPKVANFNPFDLFDGQLPPLQHLSIAGMPLKDSMWQSIFERLGASLVQCDVSRNTNFTCALVPDGSSLFSQLEDLNVSATALTLESLVVLLTVTPKLNFLDVSGCRSLDREYRRDPLSLRQRDRQVHGSVAVL